MFKASRDSTSPSFGSHNRALGMAPRYHLVRHEAALVSGNSNATRPMS